MPLENEKSPASVKRREAFIVCKNDYMKKVAPVSEGSEIKGRVATIDYIKSKGARSLFLKLSR